MLVAFDSHAVNPYIYKTDLRYDTFKDLAPVTFNGSIPRLLATSPAYPANDMPAFLSMAHTAGVRCIWAYSSSPLYSEAERIALDFSLAAASVPNAVDDEIVEITGVILLFGFMNGWSIGKQV